MVWKFCGNAQFSHSFGRIAETVWKLCLSTKFPHHEIRLNYGISRSDILIHFLKNSD